MGIGDSHGGFLSIFDTPAKFLNLSPGKPFARITEQKLIEHGVGFATLVFHGHRVTTNPRLALRDDALGELFDDEVGDDGINIRSLDGVLGVGIVILRFHGVMMLCV